MERDYADQNPSTSSDRFGMHQNLSCDPSMLKMQSKQGSDSIANNPKRGSGLMQRILESIDLWAQKYAEVSTRQFHVFVFDTNLVFLLMFVLQCLFRWPSMGN